MKSKDPFKTLLSFPTAANIFYYSLPALEKTTGKSIKRLPVSLRIILESLLRNCDGKKVTEEDILSLAGWDPLQKQEGDIPFVVSRVLLQDFTGVPLLADLSAMRDAMSAEGLDPTLIEPIVPVNLVVDHSVQVDRSGTKDAFIFNLEIEFERNQERYEFLRWGQEAFSTFKVIPPGIGIVHQVNLEHLASVVTKKAIGSDFLVYPDTVVGTDSHTTMVNGLGVLGWGVGGIEAEAAMLGQPYNFQTPEVVGVCLSGSLQEGVTATDLTLYITELLRKEKVVGKFVEFFGEGASSLTVADRATIGNMAPEYGATVGFFPVDEKTLDYLALTGRKPEHINLIKTYLTAQDLFGIPKKGEIDFSKVLTLDLSSITPCVSGPRRPQDRIPLFSLKESFEKTLCLPLEGGGYGKELSKKVCVHSEGNFHIQEAHISGGTPQLGKYQDVPSFSEIEMVSNRPSTQSLINPGYMQHLSCDFVLDHGSIVIAAITSCTNTSNPSVMIAAGLLAKKAVEKGLKVSRKIKTSLAPGSRAVTDYLEKAGLQTFLDTLGFQLVGYGCTTCIGNSGPLDENIENAIKEHDLITASVLSGNRNFEARIHAAVKANFLMSPPLVIAFALAGHVNIDLSKEPLGHDQNNNPVFLKDIWPTDKEIADTLLACLSPEIFQKRYAHITSDNPLWDKIFTSKTATYNWTSSSTYIQRPPFFSDFKKEPPPQKPLKNMRALALLGDSVTTDHISPAGAFKPSSPAGEYLISKGVTENDFNSYGSRRGNHHVMMRGTFANIRLRNQMSSIEGGFTKLIPDNEEMSIFEASKIYQKRNVPLIIFAGKDYGMGSSRDWAAKGTALLGVKVVVAKSFERIHRSNLIGMGVLPLQFPEGVGLDTIKLTGKEEFSLLDLGQLTPKQEVILEIGSQKIPLISRLDTLMDIEYYLHGGILPYVLREILKNQALKII
ncbi:MAG: aconitate hydratase [Chlamydiota bacterium]